MWYDEALKHPDGRADRGEPCVNCGDPVPRETHWKHRDRHLCSSRCNTNFKRRWKRSVEREVKAGTWDPEVLKLPDPVPNPRTSGPRDFVTTPGRIPPYEFEGFGVIPGDVVERHGISTVYGLEESPEDRPDWLASHLLITEEITTRHYSVWGAQPDGRLAAVQYGTFSPTGERLDSDTFEVDGRLVKWCTEFISDVATDGREFRWEAVVAVPVDSGYVSTWWTPARQQLSDQRKRTSRSAASHGRRALLKGATVETFDPMDVYERDGWVCGVCNRSVDRALVWPEPMSASLDHRKPLAAGGDHSRLNTQLAHLICNITKGAKYDGG
ncbi:HNH endonuclease [Nocardioides sp. BGMRC 2183]|nr:HNH endonuclease [Nocardioides sp. BGMRC 2183]